MRRAFTVWMFIQNLANQSYSSEVSSIFSNLSL